MLTHLQPSSAVPDRVVILGAGGFVARALAARLAAGGIPVLAVSSRQVDLSTPGAAAALGALLRTSDAVVMTSALTPDKGRDAATLMKNLRMAESVAAALALRPCVQLVYLSSDAVYDWRHPLISEATAPSPTDLYSTMHLAREQMLRAATSETKVPFCILRPCAIYGPGDTHNGYGPNRFARTALAEGRIRLFGAGEETRDHVFIEDVVTMIDLVLRHQSTGVLNLVSGRSPSFAEVANLVARNGARPVTLEYLPRSGIITHRHFDPTALFRAFPRFSPTPLETGLSALTTQSG